MTVDRRTLIQEFKQVSNDLWRLAFFLPATVNVWLLRDRDGLTLIDAAQPWNAKEINAAINHVGIPLKRIVITHAHPDHAGAAAELRRLTGAEVYAHAQDIPFLTGQECMANVDGSVSCKRFLKFANRIGMLNPPIIDRVDPIANGDTLGDLQVVHTPGHTPGSITLWHQKNQMLFCGDNVSHTLRVLRLNMSFFTLDCATLGQSIEKYKEFPAKMLLPGHGPEYVSNDVWEDLSQLLKFCRPA